MFDFDPVSGRFLTVESDQSPNRPSQFYVVLKWFEELKAKGAGEIAGMLQIVSSGYLPDGRTFQF